MSSASVIKEFLETKKEEFIEILSTAVKLESPTYGAKEESDKCSAYLRGLFESIGAEIKVFKNTECGDHFTATFNKGAGRKIVMVGHYDTVFKLGDLENMPCRYENGKLYGPGAYDMKSGIIIAYYALLAMKELKIMPDREIVLFGSGDEEPGSFTSKDLIVEEALGSECALILEPAPGTDINELKTSRSGRAVYKIIAHGKASHSGSAPREGISAVLEIARQIERIESMNRPEEGLTLSPTFMTGGTLGTAVIPDYAYTVVDVRSVRADLLEAAHSDIMSLAPFDPRIKLEIEADRQKPVFEFDSKNKELFEKLKPIGAELGLNLRERHVGGGSDGNFTSAAGIPTIDGMGLNGGGLHNPGEYVITENFSEKTAFLARCLQSL